MSEQSAADVIAAHRWSPKEPFVGRGGCFGCAFHGSYTEFVAHALDALEAAGYAVVKLQRPADCHACYAARNEYPNFMVLCPDCGNKRCPKATNHAHECTGSNQSGQVGSCYGEPCKQECCKAYEERRARDAEEFSETIAESLAAAREADNA